SMASPILSVGDAAPAPSACQPCRRDGHLRSGVPGLLSLLSHPPRAYPTGGTAAARASNLVAQLTRVRQPDHVAPILDWVLGGEQTDPAQDWDRTGCVSVADSTPTAATADCEHQNHHSSGDDSDSDPEDGSTKNTMHDRHPSLGAACPIEAGSIFTTELPALGAGEISWTARPGH